MYGHIIGIYMRSGERREGGKGGKREGRKNRGERKCKEAKVK